MALKFSIGAKKFWLGDGVVTTENSLRKVLNDTGGVSNGVDIAIYNGTRPDTPGDSVGSGTLLVTCRYGANGGTFDYDTVLNCLSKASDETWSGTAVAGAGTGKEAQWFRLFIHGTTHTDADSAEIRIDGTCGDTGTEDLVLADATIAENDVKTIDIFRLKLP